MDEAKRTEIMEDKTENANEKEGTGEVGTLEKKDHLLITEKEAYKTEKSKLDKSEKIESKNCY